VYKQSVARTPRPTTTTRLTLYQLGRAGERFSVGGGPVDLGVQSRPLRFGRRENDCTDVEQQVDDPWMSTQHARIVEGPQGGRLFVEDLGSRNGVLVNGARVERAPLLHGDVVEMGRTFWVFVEDRSGEPLLSSPAEFGALVTWHPRFGRQLTQLAARAATAEHVLVAGPAGSGKGFVARTLHQMSQREGRLVALDCRAHGPRDVALELFGAGTSPGRLTHAARGTLLLENVEHLPGPLQARLADGLRRREHPHSRVVATVGGAVDALVNAGSLSRGLFAALGALTVETPALEDRLCDLGILLDEFMARARGAVAIDREVCRVLFCYRFAQNVRGFARVIEAASSLAVDDDRRRKGGMIEVMHLPFCIAGVDALRALLAQANLLAGEVDVGLTGKHPRPASSAGEPAPQQPSPSAEAATFSTTMRTKADQQLPPKAPEPRQRGTVGVGLEAPLPLDPPPPVDVEALNAALRAARGNVSAAARLLGRPRAKLTRWLRDLNLDPLSFR